MDRPNRWIRSDKITISEDKYDMVKVHRFVKRSIRGTSSEIKKIKIIKNLILEGYHGLALFDKKTILLNDEDNIILKYVTLFHEIFHFYFRDYDDNRKIEHENQLDDFKERRAEKSAVNMLLWYVKNHELFMEIQIEVAKIKKEKLTNNIKSIL